MKKLILLAVYVVFGIFSVSAQTSSFASSEFGFSMNVPQGWFLVEKRVLDDSVARMDLTVEARAKLKQDDDGSTLLFLITKYPPGSKRGINPKIEGRVIPTGAKSPLTFDEFRPAITNAFMSLGSGRKDYFYLQEPTAFDVEGGRGVFQISRFTMRTTSRTEYSIRSRTLAIPYGNYYFQISFVDEFGGEDCSSVFDDLVKSIKIGNHK